MAPVPTVPTSSTIVPNGLPQPSQHHRAKIASETQREEARVVFNKTIEGHYRDGRTGYRRVGALFLTWAADDLQCKTQEAAKLRDLLRDDFHFQTEYFDIPSERWQTALHKKIADFCYEYDHAEDLAIIYYAGHAYEGRETKEFKFAAKFENDGDGDPTAFFNDIRTCVQLPNCDQLMILDCCYSARAFTRKHLGKRKFELLTSSAHDKQSPAPHLPNSFTRALYEALKRLLTENPNGFCTSHLYREVYHTLPTGKKYDTRPLLFDQARHSLGRIWLRPQMVMEKPPRAKNDGSYLKLTFRLNKDPDLAVMNELALQLQYLPHVDRIRVDDLYAPKEQISDFMRLVFLAVKLRPLVQKLHARRRDRKARELSGHNNEEVPPSLKKLQLGQNRLRTSDHIWSSAAQDLTHNPKENEELRLRRHKSGTWPIMHGDSTANGLQVFGQLSSQPKADPLGFEDVVVKSMDRRENTRVARNSKGVQRGLVFLMIFLAVLLIGQTLQE